MTPGARLAAAIEVIDDILAGQRAEPALTAWGRRSRFAGSGDRRAIRDHVYDMLRRRRSYAALGGAETGRGIAIGALRAAGEDPAALMTGEGHAPAPPSEAETGRAPGDLSVAEAADMPDWLFDRLRSDWPDDATVIAEAQRHRAPVFLRVNLARTTREDAARALAAEGIGTEPHPDVKTALKVTENERKVSGSKTYLDGLVELQDASSQAAVLALPLSPGDRVLDFCAGGGGKALAMAGLMPLSITAHDGLPQRMRDLPVRAQRAAAEIAIAATDGLAPASFDLVLVDAPCSGSGTWRRDPEGKWALTPEALDDLTDLQFRLATEAQQLVRPGGHLAYATCSVLACENDGVVERLRAADPELKVVETFRRRPDDEGDGFFLNVLRLPHRAT